MKTALGILIIAASILFGAYVGVWVFFVGGIVDVVEAVKATPVEAMGIAIGLLKVVLASTAGVLIAAIGTMFGSSLVR